MLYQALDGQMACLTFFDRFNYLPDSPVAVIDAVNAIPTVKTWPPEKEILMKRSQ